MQAVFQEEKERKRKGRLKRKEKASLHILEAFCEVSNIRGPSNGGQRWILKRTLREEKRRSTNEKEKRLIDFIRSPVTKGKIPSIGNHCLMDMIIIT